MESIDAVLTLAALGQPTRLETFRLLVRAAPEGMAAGDIAETMNVPRNTMSSHLSILTRAGLVKSERLSRQIFYKADLSRLMGLTSFLVEGCCNNQPDLCEPMLARIRTLDAGCE